jgi:CBS domain-containing protein
VGAFFPPPGAAACRAARWATLQARAVMRRDPVTVDPSCSLSEVERILAERGIGGAPVVDAAGNLLGVVSLRDVAERHAEDPLRRPRRGVEPPYFGAHEEPDEDAPFGVVALDAEDTAADVMSSDLCAVPPTADLSEIARAMVERKVHRVLVTDGGRLVGLIATLDVLDALAV